jgi:hypothetical protein
MMNGQGAQTFATGATYTGSFENNLYSGEGEERRGGRIIYDQGPEHKTTHHAHN